MGERGVKNLEKLPTLFMDGPFYGAVNVSHRDELHGMHSN